MKKYTFFLLLLALFFVVLPNHAPVEAACFTTAIGNTAQSAPCTIAADTFECADYATGNTESGDNNAVLTVTGAITINSGSAGTTRLNAGSFVIGTGGSLAVGSTKTAISVGSVGNCWVTDADADGWMASTTLNTATAAGKRRLGVMRHPSTVDCNDASYNVSNVCWSYSYGQAWYYGYGQAWYYGYGQAWYYGYGQGGYWGYGYGQSQYCSWRGGY